jgi:hypothetical protein
LFNLYNIPNESGKESETVAHMRQARRLAQEEYDTLMKRRLSPMINMLPLNTAEPVNTIIVFTQDSDKKAKSKNDNLTNNIRQIAAVGKVTGQTIKVLSIFLEALIDNIGNSHEVSGESQGTDDSLDLSMKVEDVSKVINSLNELVRSLNIS